MSAKSMIVLILVLSIFDGVMSWLGVQSGAMTEVNPFLLRKIEDSLTSFMFFKVTVTVIFCTLLAFCCKSRRVPATILAIYTIVTIIHIKEYV